MVRSLAFAASQEKHLRQRVARAVTEINALDERKQGKPRVPDEATAAHAAAAILAKHRVAGLVHVTVRTDVLEHAKRRYGTHPATTVRPAPATGQRWMQPAGRRPARPDGAWGWRGCAAGGRCRGA
jgi:hypothetical protein